MFLRVPNLSLSLSFPPPSDEMLFLGTTPANRPDSPEYSGTQHPQFDPNYQSFFHEEQLQEQAAVDEDEGRSTR